MPASRVTVAVILCLGIAARAGGPVSAGPVSAVQYRPLHELLRAIVADPRLQGAVVAARVDSLTRGQVIFAHNADQLVNPASVAKLFTTAAALALLQPDFRFKTEIDFDSRPDRGVANGPLYLKGSGDPLLTVERLRTLSQELRAFGLRKVTGGIVLDDTAFDEVEEGPGFSQDSSIRPYMAPSGALSLEYNVAEVWVLPGSQPGAPAEVRVLPPSDHYVIENRVSTHPWATRVVLDAQAHGNQTKFKLSGTVSLSGSPFRDWCRITAPTWFTGRAFRQMLKDAGIEVQGAMRRGEAPRLVDRYYAWASPSLGEIVRTINKQSQNFMAEQLFKAIGAELIGPPATWYKGERAMAAFLEDEVGLVPGTYVLQNGSGLNDTNRVTASQTIALLRYMWRRKDILPDFLASLAVAGADGTVAGRFRDPAVARSMRLKTGSLEQVRTLAGYVNTQGGEALVLCILVSRYHTESAEVIELINRFAAALSRADADRLVAEQVDAPPYPPLPEPDLLLNRPALPPGGEKE